MAVAPSVPQRANSDTQTPSKASLLSSAEIEDEETLNTSMPTEILRSLGQSSNSAGHTSPNGGADDRLQSIIKEAAHCGQLPEADWYDVKQDIKRRIAEVGSPLETVLHLSTLTHIKSQHVETFRKDENTLFDKANEPPWILEADEIECLVNEVNGLLDNFIGSPPHTIQRLCELVLSPSPHYARSLAKYMRAVFRCLLVTSGTSNFPPTPTISTSQINGDGTHSAVFGMRSAPSGSLSPASALPLLSPIPFLQKNLPSDDENEGLEVRTTVPGAPEASSASLMSPTGGKIDELDPGPAARLAIAASEGTAANAATMSDGPVGLGLEPSSLSDRFVSAGEKDVDVASEAIHIVDSEQGSKLDDKRQDAEMQTE